MTDKIWGVKILIKMIMYIIALDEVLSYLNFH